MATRYVFVILLLLGHWLLGTAVSAQMATIDVRSPLHSAVKPVPHLHFQGPVRAGDLERIAALVAKRVACDAATLPEEGGNCAVLTLDSGGGNYVEGLRIAHFLRENSIATWVQAGHGCYSACAMAFMGGSGHSSQVGAYVDRTVEPGGVVGFHAPYLTHESLTELIAEIGLEEVLGGNRSSIALMVEQLAHWNVDRSVISRMVDMDPDVTFDTRHAQELYLLRIGLPPAPVRMWILDPVNAVRNACIRLLAYHKDAWPFDVREQVPLRMQYDFGEDGYGRKLSGFQLLDPPSGLAISYCALPTIQAHLGGDADISLYSGPGIDGKLRPFVSFFHRPNGWSSMGVGGSADRRIFQKGSIGHFFLLPETELGGGPLALTWRLMREDFLSTGESGR